MMSKKTLYKVETELKSVRLQNDIIEKRMTTLNYIIDIFRLRLESLEDRVSPSRALFPQEDQVEKSESRYEAPPGLFDEVEQLIHFEGYSKYGRKSKKAYGTLGKYWYLLKYESSPVQFELQYAFNNPSVLAHTVPDLSTLSVLAEFLENRYVSQKEAETVLNRFLINNRSWMYCYPLKIGNPYE